MRGGVKGGVLGELGKRMVRGSACAVVAEGVKASTDGSRWTGVLWNITCRTARRIQGLFVSISKTARGVFFPELINLHLYFFKNIHIPHTHIYIYNKFVRN